MDKEFETELSLGAKLSEALPNTNKIVINVLWRTALCFFCMFAAIRGMSGINRWMEEGPALWELIFFGVILVFGGLWPLTHLQDKLEFYERGMIFKKKAYYWKDLGEPRWHNSGSAITSTYMKTNVKGFNVTYLTHPKKAYNQAYMKH